MSSMLLGYLRGRVQSLEETNEEWHAHSQGLENTIAQLRAENETLRGNYRQLHAQHENLRENYRKLHANNTEVHEAAAALREGRNRYRKSSNTWKGKLSVVTGGATAQKDYLLGLLDAAHGDADNNPARKRVGTGLEVLFGENQGMKLNGLESAYLRGVRKALSENPDAAANPDVRALGFYDKYGEAQPEAPASEAAAETANETANETAQSDREE